MPYVVLRTADGHQIVASNGGNVGVPTGLSPDSVPFLTTATSIGPNETFTLEPQGNFHFALKTQSGNYVAAPNGGGLGTPPNLQGTPALTTDGEVTGPAETFNIIPISREESTVVLQCSDHSYVTAVNGGGIGAPPGFQRDAWPLVTDATEIGPNSTFLLHYEPPGKQPRSIKPSQAEVNAQNEKYAPLTHAAGEALENFQQTNAELINKLKDKLLTGEQLVWGPMFDTETADLTRSLMKSPEFKALSDSVPDEFTNRQSIAIGINFGIAAAIDLEGFIGLIIDIKSGTVMVIETFLFGIRTNIEIHIGIGVTYYFTPASDTLGWGYNFVLSAGEGYEFSVGFTVNPPYFAPTASRGAGAGVLPIDAAGTASYTWGSEPFGLDHLEDDQKRVLVVLKNGVVMHNSGSDDIWKTLSTPHPVFSIQSWGHRVAYQTKTGTLYAMEGPLNPIPAAQYTNIGSFQIYGNRIGVRQGKGIFYKEGALNAGWTSWENTNVFYWQMIEDRLAVVDATNFNLLVKPKPWNAGWVTVANNVKQMSIASGIIMYVDDNDTLYAAIGTDLNNLVVENQLDNVVNFGIATTTMVATTKDGGGWAKGPAWGNQWKKLTDEAGNFAVLMNPDGTAFDRTSRTDAKGALYVSDGVGDPWHQIVPGAVEDYLISGDRTVVRLRDGQVRTLHVYEGPASNPKLAAQISGVSDYTISQQWTF